MTDIIVQDDNEIKTSRWTAYNWLSWTQYSEIMLRTIEKNIFKFLKTSYRGWYVDIGPVVGPADKIWTISLNTESKNTPLVLLHGLGAGVALWCLNLDAFSANRPVYAFDLLGFGRSSRPVFNKDAAIAESELVRSIEEWRREMKLEKFILLGHSLGGFLAASYALNYPERIKHLILADPWGFTERPKEVETQKVPIWVRAIAYTLSPFNPFAAVRIAGPLGQWLVDRAKADIAEKFSGYLEDYGLITKYLYQCNSQFPSGETVFFNMMLGDFRWTRNPLCRRIDSMDENISVTILYGELSWIDQSGGDIAKEKLKHSYINIRVVPGSGHHIFVDNAEAFNEYVVDACNYADELISEGYCEPLHILPNHRISLLEAKEDPPLITPIA